jgi:hypothetical protein
MSARLPGWKLGWRAVVSIAVLAAVVQGTWRGGDEWWPFAPMSQFAFPVANDGAVIRSTFVEADTVDGEVVQVPLSAGGVGLPRAEIEGQLPRFLREPSMLQAIAVAHARLHPHQARYAVLRLRETVTTLRKGVPSSASTDTLASWTVLDLGRAAGPPELP